jgi:hypothetical protein
MPHRSLSLNSWGCAPTGHSPKSFKASPEGQRPSAHQAAEPQTRHFIPLMIFMNTDSNIDLPDGGKLATLSLITSMTLQRRWLRINEMCGT